MAPTLSVIIPTRERANYLRYAIQTCTASREADLEILILDNASTDNTAETVSAVTDPRIRYERSDSRLSMRDNFERGVRLARGKILCFIGDDDGLMPNAAADALTIFSKYNVDAVSAARAHYFWPDLISPRRNTGLLPRGNGISVGNTREALKTLLEHCDYYRTPCLYHGFVKKDVVDRIAQRQGRFFLSNQVDIFSAIALSAENLRYAYSQSPLIINGGSGRSNGASHFGGGGDQEKKLWMQEDDIGFLPGFENSITMGAYLLESAIRYTAQSEGTSIMSMFESQTVHRTLAAEARARLAAGRSADEIDTLFKACDLPPDAGKRRPRVDSPLPSRLRRLLRSYLANLPVNFESRNVVDVYGASRHFGRMIVDNEVGLLRNTGEQIRTSLRILRS